MRKWGRGFSTLSRFATARPATAVIADAYTATSSDVLSCWVLLMVYVVGPHTNDRDTE